MHIDYFRAAEQDIASLPYLIRARDNLRRRLDRMTPLPEPTGKTGPYTSTSDVNITLQRQCDKAEVKAELVSTEADIAEIKTALDGVREDLRRVLILFYHDKLSAECIAERLHFETVKPIYKMRNQGIAEYALLYYGAKAKPVWKKNGP
ncbi:MAG: hypothetical protein ACI3XR_10015 [Eubacteriales bacterium]